MDPHPTPFPGKNQPLKPNPHRKTTGPSKPASREHVTYRQKRVFGTVRNANIPTRTVSEKPAVAKPSNAGPRKQPQRTRPARVPVATEAAKKGNYPENLKPESDQKSVSLQEEVGKETPIEKLRTPVMTASPSLSQRKIAVGSPYQSAKICSKCRFDKLETSAYWLAQIKLSESVGKHFVSAAFFRLAFESKAEPNRNLRIELKKYLVRNGHLAGQTEWKGVCVRYGVLKEEKETECFDSAIMKSDVEHHAFCQTEEIESM
ncbi:hypothetical protein L484_014399 [Morus notabilis]|uniref:Uncharacterized protein n=1 Tax=Morus notabilis TaxID=981085 RepID=W9SC99_9ROSA|nr:uncharacterized protein LOC21397542 isoform X2 [Morus notabilis]EXB98557.1 hypothetical protein L484_014399 [Morus notabilis]